MEIFIGNQKFILLADILRKQLVHSDKFDEFCLIKHHIQNFCIYLQSIPDKNMI